MDGRLDEWINGWMYIGMNEWMDWWKIGDCGW